jgi:hypothetical protein
MYICTLPSRERQPAASMAPSWERLLIPSPVFPRAWMLRIRLRLEWHLIAQKDFSVMQMPTYQTT